ncbi:unnamed protein product [Bursaphelenchus okinawaensis]|uniref:RanBP2-type domain-containing protein n=1 Tax=Bursaphelenchus okinawaensis TaxID=465554 RepID=A0A811K8V5_9BILA|nr:unnamed protein product [Bursaphelenchus okinawaensis]CAG9096228.1 unnamed protein product [Bursaphelenchus okinawaensis]
MADPTVNAERLLQRFEDTLKTFTEHYLTLQKTVITSHAQMDAKIARIEQSLSQLNIEGKSQTASMNGVQRSVCDSHEREVTRLVGLLETVLQTQMKNQTIQAQAAAQQQSIFGLLNNLSNQNAMASMPMMAPQMQQPGYQAAASAAQLPMASIQNRPAQPQQPIFQQAVQQPVSQSFAAPKVEKPAQPIFQAPQQVPAAVPVSAIKQEPKPIPAPAVSKPTPAQQPAAPKPTGGFGDQFNKKAGEWDCKGCYVRNAADKTVCPCCNLPKDAAPGDKPAAPAFKPSSFTAPAVSNAASGFSFGLAKPATTAATTPAAAKPSTDAATPTTTPATATPTSTPKPAGSVFGGGINSSQNTSSSFSFKPFATPSSANQSQSSTTDSPKPSLFGGNTGGLTFGSVSQNTSGTSFLAGKDNSFSFQVDPRRFAVFPPRANEGNEEANEDEPEAFQPDDSQFKKQHFALPEIVEVKTGEEDEDVLFNSRAKLYRFDPQTKEVKERGVGDIRLLKNRKSGVVRCVMRREQVLKLCANFAIKGITVDYKKGRSDTLVWSCNDFSEVDEKPDGECVVLICRFKEDTDATNFKKLVEENQ